MSAQRKAKIDPYRRSLYGKIEVAKKQLGIDDDTYRDILREKFGKDSRKSLDNAQLVDLIEHFRALGFKPIRKAKPGRGPAQQANTGEQKKIRAVWVSLWHLGVLRSNSDEALAAFCKRVTGGRVSGVAALQWIRDYDAVKVIEALKAMATRDGGVCWDPYSTQNGPIHHPRYRVIEAQWRKLVQAGAVKIEDTSAIVPYVRGALGIECHKFYLQFTDDEADRAIVLFGGKIRGLQARQKSREKESRL